MEKQEFIKQIAGYVKSMLPGTGLKYIALLLPRQYLKAVGEKADWPPCTIIILD